MLSCYFLPLHLYYVFVLICQYDVVLLERTNTDIIYIYIYIYIYIGCLLLLRHETQRQGTISNVIEPQLNTLVYIIT